MTYLIILYLAIINRLSGSHYKYFGLLLYPLPYIYIIYSNIYIAIILYIWIFMMKKLGHADGFQGYERDNFLSKILSPITNKLKINRKGKLYDFLFWLLKGGLITFPFIFLGYYELFIFSMIAYPIAYHLGFNYLGLRKDKNSPYELEYFNIKPKIPMPKKLYMGATVWGELLSGTFSGLGFLFI